MDGTPREIFAQVERLHELGLAAPDTVELMQRLNRQGDAPAAGRPSRWRNVRMRCTGRFGAEVEVTTLEPIIRIEQLTHTYSAGTPFRAQRRGWGRAGYHAGGIFRASSATRAPENPR